MWCNVPLAKHEGWHWDAASSLAWLPPWRMSMRAARVEALGRRDAGAVGDDRGGGAGAAGMAATAAELSQHETLVLMAIAYFQPVTRGKLGRIFGKEVSRDTIAVMRREGLIDAGPRSPQARAPYTYVTTPAFLSRYGFETLRDLPDFEKLEDAGLLSKAALLQLDVLEGLNTAEQGNKAGPR